MASTYLTHTMSTPTNRKKSTISAWVKKTSEGANSTIFGGGDAATDCAFLNFNTSDKLFLQSATSDSADWGITTSAVFRDSAAWYHVVAKIDTTQSTSTDRVKIYVNGNLQTVTGSYPSQNYDMQWSRNGEVQLVGKYPSTGIYFNGVMAHVHFTDGYAYDASTFGETDSTSGIWKPKTAPSVTYGTNGFFLKFENSAAMGTDSSGQSNTFTVNNSVTQNIDSPSNNFATGNPLNPDGTSTTTLINGNLTHNNNVSATGTIAVDKGKWYFEVKRQDNGGSITNWMYCGYRPIDRYVGTSRLYRSSNGDYYNGSSYSSYGASWGDGDIIGIALDYDNDKIEFYKNGVSQGAKTSIGLCDGTLVTPQWQCSQSSGSPHLHANFGSGFFGTTAVASANADGNGFGAFEYAVPSGYYALCTKNIKEFG
tara:strand:- start:1321 stop:2592 length:1272 start_codon:yes stop_codon:yes gene_type:complete